MLLEKEFIIYTYKTLRYVQASNLEHLAWKEITLSTRISNPYQTKWCSKYQLTDKPLS